MWQYILQSLQSLASVTGVLYILLGATIGMLFGSLPGLSGGTIMVMLLPITYRMNPVLALALFIAMLAAGVLARWGVKLGPWEYAAMCFCAVAMVIGLSQGNMIKGFAGVGLAILLCSIGPDPITGRMRLAFGNVYLYDGFNIINIMLGMFAAKIILLEYARQSKAADASRIKVRGFRWPGKDLKDNLGNLIRSFVTGAFIGFLPGLGAPTSTVIAYSNERNLDKKHPELWGHGHIGGAMIPMLALGIPGDAIMVQFMAVMSIHGVTTGPMLMRTNPEMVYMLYTAAIIAAIFVLGIQVGGMPLFPKFISMPYHFLYPAIIIISFIGAYMTAGNMMGVLVTLCACLLGLVMDYFEVPTTPFIMMFILSSLLEKNIRQGMNFSFNGVWSFFTRPISLAFILVGVAVLALHTVLPVIKKARAKKQEQSK